MPTRPPVPAPTAAINSTFKTIGKTLVVVLIGLAGFGVIRGLSDSTDDAVTIIAGAASERSGGTVRVAETYSFTSFNNDESDANTDINSKVVATIRSDFTYIDNELNIVPDPSFGTYKMSSNDPLTVTYKVNDNQVWSDGNAIDKADMLLNWAIQSGHFNGPINDDGVVEPSFFAFAGSTDGLGLTDMPTFADDGTMTVVYSEPYVDWEIAFSMALPPAHVVAERAGMTEDELVTLLETATPGEANEQLSKVAEVWNKGFVVKEMPTGDNANLLVSSGPMIVTDFVPGQSITLSVNDQYVGDLKSQVDEITVRFIGDPAAAVNALRNGEVDIIAPQPSVDTVKDVKAIEGVNVLEGSQLSYDHVDLRYNTGPMSDINVRKAFLLTIPREAILDRLIRTMNPSAEVVNSQIYLPTDGDRYTKSTDVNGSDAYADVDIEKAKELLNGQTPEIRVMYNNGNPNRVDTFAMIQESATQAGFEIIDNGLPRDEWIQQLANPEMDVTIFGWISSGVGSASIPQLFATSGSGNYSGYSSAKVDSLTKQLMVATDDETAHDLRRQVDTELFNDAFGLPLFQGPGFIAHADTISGVKRIPYSGAWGSFWEWSVKG